jgi:hypothetical protein
VHVIHIVRGIVFDLQGINVQHIKVIQHHKNIVACAVCILLEPTVRQLQWTEKEILGCAKDKSSWKYDK